jgi:CspA family cold shock protein
MVNRPDSWGQVAAIGGMTMEFFERKIQRRKRHMSQTGTVKFFNNDKGFGFIKPDDGGADIFVHISAVQASGLNGLSENQKVKFETEPDNRGKGPKAVNLELA